MKKFITILFMFLPFVLFCQTGDSTKAKKIKIGITYSPDYSYRTLKPDAENKWIADIRDTLETPKFGYTVGLNIIYVINKKFALQAGVLFSDKGERTKKYVLGNPQSGSLPVNNTFIYHYRYLDIPVKVNYYLLTGKVKLFLTAGVSANIFLSQKTVSVLEYNDRDSEISKSTTNKGFSKVNVAFLAGFGMNYDLTKKLEFSLEPIYNRSINSIIDAPVKSYLYSAGINIGIFYKL